ncbi:hypothetical protein [Desulfobulbus alkaliphilus]|uniref:hypothetical protein n=1 Tax=Desulfobulbus alkaliphilus TaxID=869814 RepID=UPI001964FB49|nr:hypothetical protein [Desulfobulbus alkaliphilus]MBM9535692.1 hypothetical protein [Desulfobulbus alkaliphilus]
MLICLSELAERVGLPIRFVAHVRNPDAAPNVLFLAEKLYEHIEVVRLADFNRIRFLQ